MRNCSKNSSRNKWSKKGPRHRVTIMYSESNRLNNVACTPIVEDVLFRGSSCETVRKNGREISGRKRDLVITCVARLVFAATSLFESPLPPRPVKPAARAKLRRQPPVLCAPQAGNTPPLGAANGGWGCGPFPACHPGAFLPGSGLLAAHAVAGLHGLFFFSGSAVASPPSVPASLVSTLRAGPPYGELYQWRHEFRAP